MYNDRRINVIAGELMDKINIANELVDKNKCINNKPVDEMNV